MNLSFNHSWLHGNYPFGELNTYLDFVHLEDFDFYAHGQEAIAIFEEILDIWVHSGESREQAFETWVYSHFT